MFVLQTDNIDLISFKWCLANFNFIVLFPMLIMGNVS